MSKSAQQNPQPWWKFGHVWMVLAGPAVVVVAGFVTLYIAVRTPDPVVTDYYRKGAEINKTPEAAGAAGLTPAMQARNHAATGVVPAGKPESKP